MFDNTKKLEKILSLEDQELNYKLGYYRLKSAEKQVSEYIDEVRYYLNSHHDIKERLLFTKDIVLAQRYLNLILDGSPGLKSLFEQGIIIKSAKIIEKD